MMVPKKPQDDAPPNEAAQNGGKATSLEAPALASVTDSESQLQAIIENLPYMVFVKDAETLRFVRVNRAAETLLGYDRAELVGKTDHDFFPKSEADFFTHKDREVFANRVVTDIPEEPIETRTMGRRILHTKKIP